jgi:hypothetical protein
LKLLDASKYDPEGYQYDFLQVPNIAGEIWNCWMLLNTIQRDTSMISFYVVIPIIY